MTQPDLTWFMDNFEPVRGEAWPDAPASICVCLRCGVLVPRYAAATHLNWHRQGSPAGSSLESRPGSPT